jgi:hypothetical protein
MNESRQNRDKVATDRTVVNLHQAIDKLELIPRHLHHQQL